MKLITCHFVQWEAGGANGIETRSSYAATVRRFLPPPLNLGPAAPEGMANAPSALGARSAISPEVPNHSIPQAAHFGFQEKYACKLAHEMRKSKGFDEEKGFFFTRCRIRSRHPRHPASDSAAPVDATKLQCGTPERRGITATTHIRICIVGFFSLPYLSIKTVVSLMPVHHV